MSQVDRIEHALTQAGETGITAYEFATEPPDGGPRIMRLAARIRDLEDRGYPVIVRGDRRLGHVIYRKEVSTQSDPLAQASNRSLTIDQTDFQAPTDPERVPSMYDAFRD